MRKLNKTEKILSISLGIFVLLYFVEKVVFSTFSGKIDVIDVKIKAKEEKYEQLLYIDANREMVLDIYKGVKPYIEMDKSESDSVSVIMKQIEEMAKENRINLLKMRPEAYESTDGEKYKVKKFTLTIEGGQRDIMKFFYKIEDNQYPLSINKMDLRIKDRVLSIMTAEIDVFFMYYN